MAAINRGIAEPMGAQLLTPEEQTKEEETELAHVNVTKHEDGVFYQDGKQIVDSNGQGVTDTHTALEIVRAKGNLHQHGIDENNGNWTVNGQDYSNPVDASSAYDRKVIQDAAH